MTWSNVKLIFNRETRDQLRDRRTLFTIAIMPIVLYPLMGMAMLQVAQFTREHPTRIWMVGTENLPQSPSLLLEGELNPEWIETERPELLQIMPPNDGDDSFRELISKVHEDQSMPGDPDLINQVIDDEMKTRAVDLAVVFVQPGSSDGEVGFVDSGAGDGPSVYILHN